MPLTISLSASPTGGGTVSGGGVKDCGTSVTVTASPDPCYTFVNWTEGSTVVSTNPSYTFTAEADRTLVANFQINTYNITVAAGANGNITPSENVTVDCGTDQTFTFTPEINYKIDKVLIDGENNPVAVENGSYTFEYIIEAHSIEVTFKEIVGILELASSKIIVYPNPTTSELRVENGGLKIEKMEFFDVFGRNVGINTHVCPEKSGSDTVLNISHFPVGVYFLRITTEAGEVIKKVLKE